MSLNAHVAALVRRLRKARRMTGKVVEEATAGAVSINTLSRLENEETKWTLDHLEAVATALGVEPRDLLPGPVDQVDQVELHRDNPAPGPALRPGEAELLEAVRAGDLASVARALAELTK